MKGFVVWLTGMSGSGKSTLATLLAAELRERGLAVEVLDGDEVRRFLSKGLGFSKEDRDTNVRRVGFVAKLLARVGGCAITSSISPYREVRDEQRKAIGDFVEVYCRCSLDVLKARDPKGLYKKVAAGEIEHFTGIDDPYEPPLSPDVEVDTGSLDKKAAVAAILTALVEKGYLADGEPVSLARPHGGELPLLEPLEEDAARALPMLEVGPHVEATTELLASGALAPVWGFLSSKDRTRVKKEMRLESGLPFGWPALLPAPRGVSVELGQRWALASGGSPFAVAKVSEVEKESADETALGAILVEARPEWCGVAERVREELRERIEATAAVERTGRVIGLHLDRPLAEREGLALKLALASADAGVVLISRAAGVDVESIRGSIEAVVSSTRVAVVALPPPPDLDPERAALMRALLLKNLGATVILAADGSTAILRGALARFSRAEMGISLLAFSDELLDMTAR